ncbi:MAG: type II toxin-antitoxin system PemK/MazF family toxin [Cellulomonadaceae bacterium]|jgi:mRNA interferase MazF|nr:type II toxin-antitoxin system PemK/MazF family toxin [Cellulomonadaceae bacterium]
MVTLTRGDVVWIDFGEPRGSAPAYRRPAVVIQSDLYNQSRIATTVVCAITSNTALARFSDNVFVPADTSGLGRDSVIVVSQVYTVDKGAVEYPVGAVPSYILDQAEAGLKSVLSL